MVNAIERARIRATSEPGLRRWRRGGSSYGCLFTLLVLAAVLYFGAKIAEAYYHFYEYQDVMVSQAKFASHYTDDEIRLHLAAKADSLGLPADAALLAIDRTPHHIVITSDYVETVELPLHVRHISFSPRGEADY